MTDVTKQIVSPRGRRRLRDVGMCFLGIAGLLYSLFTSDFAERHLSIPGLGLPVFVGEVLLAFSFLLMILGRIGPFADRRALPAWALYGGMVAAYAWIGYRHDGLLAFRHAALFYYIFFAAAGAAFFRPALFDERVKVALAALIGVTARTMPYNDYFFLTYLGLYLILAIRLRPPVPRWAFVLAAPFLFDVKAFFANSRSHLVGVAAAGLFLAVFFLLIHRRVSWRLRIAAAVLAVVGFLIGAARFADPNGLKTLTTPGHVLDRWREEEAKIAARRDRFRFEPLEVRLYKDNDEVRLRDRQRREEIAREAAARRIRTASPDGGETGGASVDRDAGGSISSRMQRSAQAALGGPSAVPEASGPRPLSSAYNNILFRLFIWRDMIEDLTAHRAFFGMGFGRPLRSRSLEILDWVAYEMTFTGWITPHNSFLNYVYRAGVFGVAVVVGICAALGGLIRVFVRRRDPVGAILVAVLIYWLVLAQFLVILELPYFAVPFWSLFGMTWAYAHGKREGTA